MSDGITEAYRAARAAEGFEDAIAFIERTSTKDLQTRFGLKLPENPLPLLAKLFSKHEILFGSGLEAGIVLVIGGGAYTATTLVTIPLAIQNSRIESNRQNRGLK